VAAILIGPAAQRLKAIEEMTRRRFFIDCRDDVPLDHFHVLAKGPVDKVAPDAPIAEGDEREVKLVELGLYDPSSGVGKVGGFEVAVSGAAGLVGKRVNVRVERVLPQAAYATIVGSAEAGLAPITAEGLAERPTRQQRSRRAQPEAPEELEVAPEEPPAGEVVGEGAPVEGAEEPPKRKKTRRGSRGGRRRRKAPSATTAEAAASSTNGPVEPVDAELAGPKIHVPEVTLGREVEPEPAENGGQAVDDTTSGAPKRKRTRRGSRGGRGRRKKPAAIAEATVDGDA
jgi:predicted RNA-binding protein with TRAM domain